MAKSKGTRLVITLECTECRKNEMKRSSGVSRYSTKKNRKNTPERIELNKFCDNRGYFAETYRSTDFSNNHLNFFPKGNREFID